MAEDESFDYKKEGIKNTKLSLIIQIHIIQHLSVPHNREIDLSKYLLSEL